MSRRRGMILVESSSGEYDTLAKLHELAATDSESEGEGAVDYGLVESSSPSSGDDGSYHSDNDELAEYWDPYRKSPWRADRANYARTAVSLLKTISSSFVAYYTVEVASYWYFNFQGTRKQTWRSSD